MIAINYVKDICPVTEFRSKAPNLLQQIKKEHRPLVLTQHGRSTAVVLGVEDYNKMVQELDELRAIETGRNQIATGKTLTHAEVKRRMNAKIQNG